MTESLLEQLLNRYFVTHSEVDADLRPANIVEALYAISNAAHRIATALEEMNAQGAKP